MCGIFAQAGAGPVADRLVEGLKRLEYRGYDSAGIATLEPGGITRLCSVGKVVALEERVRDEAPKGRVGIAHTRWATHGKPSERNAHPHIAPGVAVVHNGIIENHRALRQSLTEEGAVFRSETDSEVIPWLMSKLINGGMSPAEALRHAGEQMHGAFAIAAMCEQEPDRIHAIRRGSPLAVGLGETGAILASDPNALAGFAREAILMEDGDRAELTAGGVEIFDRSGVKATRQVVPVNSATSAQLDDRFPHHMLREIHEQPDVIARILAEYAHDGHLLGRLSFDFRKVSRVTLVACGSSYYAAMLARQWFQDFANLPAEVAIASEYRYEPLAPAMPDEVAILISQSGETADTIGAMQRLQARGVKTLALVNQPASTLGREADCMVPLQAGPEIGVASTKAFSAQLVMLALLALAAASRRGNRTTSLIRPALHRLPDMLTALLHGEPAVKEVAQHIVAASSAVYVGRGALFPIAMEGALKLKEISYIHAEGFAAGELKHGPIALVDAATPVIALASSGPLFEKTASNIREIAARSGRIVLVGDRAALLQLSDVASHTLTVPQCDALTQPIVSTLPLQLLAYHVALLRGFDVDRPRNLAKSVTVE